MKTRAVVSLTLPVLGYSVSESIRIAANINKKAATKQGPILCRRDDFHINHSKDQYSRGKIIQSNNINMNNVTTIEELRETDWYKSRPDIIKAAIEEKNPMVLYKFKNSGKQCHIHSYDEPTDDEPQVVTVTVQKTGKGGYLDSLGMGHLDTNKVFGVKLDDLELWEL